MNHHKEDHLSHNGCGLILPFLDSCTYRLEKEELVVTELFEILDSFRDLTGIVDLGIN